METSLQAKEIMAYGITIEWESLRQFKEACKEKLEPVEFISKKNKIDYCMWITPYEEDSSFNAYPILGEHSEPFFMNHKCDLCQIVVEAVTETVLNQEDKNVLFYIGICFYNEDYPVIKGHDGIPLLISNDLQWEIISNELDEWQVGDTSDPPFTGYCAAHGSAPFPAY